MVYAYDSLGPVLGECVSVCVCVWEGAIPHPLVNDLFIWSATVEKFSNIRILYASINIR